MTPDQVIAGRLSEAQKRILMDPRFDPKGWEPADPYNKHLVPMVDAGLFARRDGRCGFEAFKDAFIVPTDLGISIRQALLQEERS